MVLGLQNTLSKTLFLWGFTFYIVMQFAVSAAAASTIWFYAAVLPAFLYYLYHYRTENARVFSHPLVRVYGGFFLFILLHAVVFSAYHEGTSKVIRNALASGIFFYCAIGFFSALRDAQKITFLQITAIISGACALISIVIYLVIQPEDPRLIPLGRANTQVLAAFIYTFGAITTLAALLHSPSWRWRAGLVLCLFADFAVVLLTQSRMAMMICTLSLLVGGIALCRKHPKICAFMVVCSVLAVAITLAAYDTSLGEYLNSMLERGDSFRLELWELTLERIQAHPWRGNGVLAQIRHHITTSPHNVYLATVMALGIPGGIFLLGLLLYLGISLMRQLKFSNPYTLFVWLALLNALSSGLIDHSRIVKGPSPLWIIFWLPLAIAVAECVNRRKLRFS